MMHFEHLLNALLGPRKIFYALECEICGFDEIYYEDEESSKLIGKACAGCNFVQKFDFD